MNFYIFDYTKFNNKYRDLVNKDFSVFTWDDAFRAEGFVTSKRSPFAGKGWTLSDEEFTMFVLRFGEYKHEF